MPGTTNTLCLETKRTFTRADGDVHHPEVSYAQQHVNKAIGANLRVDGRLGPKTEAAIRQYQESRKLATSGELGQRTWYHIDWEAYDGWTPARKTLTGTSPGGPAILKGCNELNGQPVNERGLTRVTQRAVDMVNHHVKLKYGHGRAVKRNRRGSSRPSKHWEGLAADPMTDLDKDLQLEPEEILQSTYVAELLVARAMPWKPEPMTRQRYTEGVENPNRQKETVTEYWRGPDRLVAVVWHNHRLISGHYWQPGIVGRNIDWSWGAQRGTWKHTNPAAKLRKLHHNHVHHDEMYGEPAQLIIP